MFIRKSPTFSKIEYVNLKQVSYINVMSHQIVLNMITTYTDKTGRLISNQHFLEPDNNAFMQSKYFTDNFIVLEGSDRLTYINKNFVSSVIGESSLSGEDKIIVTFTNAVNRVRDAWDRLIPEFLYVRVKEGEEVNSVLSALVAKLGE
jgi:hypothetical protein